MNELLLYYSNKVLDIKSKVILKNELMCVRVTLSLEKVRVCVCVCVCVFKYIIKKRQEKLL